MLLSSPPAIQREAAAAKQKNRDQSQKHAKVGSPFMHGCPEAMLQQGKLGGGERNRNDDEKRHRSERRTQAEDEQCAANNLDNADQWGREVRSRDAYMDKATGAQCGGIKKFLNAFREKNPADEKA